MANRKGFRFRYLERDTLARFHSVHIEDCKRTHDSIRMEFSRLALSKSCTYKDVLLVKEQVSPHLKDAELHRAAEAIRPFFVSLDSHPVCPGNRQRILAAYRDVLTQTTDYGIHCIANLTIYIEKRMPYSVLSSHVCPISMVWIFPISHMTRSDAAHRYSLPPSGTTSPIRTRWSIWPCAPIAG